MKADDWIASFAAKLNTAPPSEEVTAELLELAATAAHNSERIAAPIACYLVGLTGASLEDARAAAEKIR
jgi:hypothetical protein